MRARCPRSQGLRRPFASTCPGRRKPRIADDVPGDLTLPRHRANVPGMSAPEPLPDCYEGDPELLPPGEAMRRIRAHVLPVEEIETIPVIDALERVAARDVVSPMNVPGHTNSAMGRLRVRRRFAAGRRASVVRRPGHGVRRQAVLRSGRTAPGGADHDRRGHARRRRHRGHAGARGSRRRPCADTARHPGGPARARGRRGHRGRRGRGPARAPADAGRDGSARVARDRRRRRVPPAAGRVLLDR